MGYNMVDGKEGKYVVCVYVCLSVHLSVCMHKENKGKTCPLHVYNCCPSVIFFYLNRILLPALDSPSSLCWLGSEARILPVSSSLVLELQALTMMLALSYMESENWPQVLLFTRWVLYQK